MPRSRRFRRGCRPARTLLAVGDEIRLLKATGPMTEMRRARRGAASGRARRRPSRDPLRLPEERRALGRREVVKEERREDDVDAPVREGEREGVGDDGGPARREAGVRRLEVETEREGAASRRANAERRSRPTCPEPQPRSSTRDSCCCPRASRGAAEEPPDEGIRPPRFRWTHSMSARLASASGRARRRRGSPAGRRPGTQKLIAGSRGRSGRRGRCSSTRRRSRSRPRTRPPLVAGRSGRSRGRIRGPAFRG